MIEMFPPLGSRYPVTFYALASFIAPDLAELHILVPLDKRSFQGHHFRFSIKTQIRSFSIPQTLVMACTQGILLLVCQPVILHIIKCRSDRHPRTFLSVSLYEASWKTTSWFTKSISTWGLGVHNWRFVSLRLEDHIALWRLVPLSRKPISRTCVTQTAI